jgi:hypothetical protein
MRRRLISGKPSITGPVRYALAVFSIGMVIGWIVTYFVAARLVSDMPADEVIEAMQRENRTFEYSLIGWGITFVASSASAVAVWYRLYDRYAPRGEDELGQARRDQS